MPTKLEWKKARKESTPLGFHRIIESKCNRYRAVLSHIAYGAGKNGIPDQWIAFWREKNRIISRHRKQSAAKEACEKHAKANEPTTVQRGNVGHKRASVHAASRPKRAQL
jgi:hypothetical protein